MKEHIILREGYTVRDTVENVEFCKERNLWTGSWQGRRLEYHGNMWMEV